MDLADASLVLLAEHPGHGRILSTDQRETVSAVVGITMPRTVSGAAIPLDLACCEPERDAVDPGSPERP